MERALSLSFCVCMCVCERASHLVTRSAWITRTVQNGSCCSQKLVATIMFPLPLTIDGAMFANQFAWFDPCSVRNGEDWDMGGGGPFRIWLENPSAETPAEKCRYWLLGKRFICIWVNVLGVYSTLTDITWTRDTVTWQVYGSRLVLYVVEVPAFITNT